MTWETPCGCRVLKGAEAELVCTVLQVMHADLEMFRDEETEASYDYGIDLFDRLPFPSKIALLVEVARGLLRYTKRCPQITAYRQSAIATIYSVLWDEVDTEIFHRDDPEDADRLLPKDFYRTRIIEAVGDLEGETPEIPEPGDVTGWQLLVESLEECVLHDMDYASVDTHLDLAPEHGAYLKHIMGIADDFYISPAPDPTEKGLKKASRDLSRLSTWKPLRPDVDRR